MRRSAFLVVAFLLAFPAGAAAQSGNATVSLTPATAGKPSRLSLDASGQAAYTGQQPPKSASLFIARGFKVDPRAAAERCSDSQASSYSCPARSRVATGSAQGEVTLTLLGGTVPFTATFEAFLASRVERGDVADFIVQATAGSRRASGRGRLLPVGGGGPFGLELRFADLSFPQPPPGSSVKLNRLHLDVSADRAFRKVRYRKRRVRTRHGKRKVRRKRIVRRGRYHLITNPPSCSGSWPYQVRTSFPNQPDFVRDDSVACSAR